MSAPAGLCCSECGWQRGRNHDWFRCEDRVFCSTECAIVFLLAREALR